MDGRTRRMVLGLLVFQVGDAILCAVPNSVVQADLDRLGVPKEVRRAIPVVKAASAVGLAALGLRHRRIGALTSACLLLYFVLAFGAHVRTRDEAWRYVGAVGMLGWCFRTWRAFRPVAATA